MKGMVNESSCAAAIGPTCGRDCRGKFHLVALPYPNVKQRISFNVSRCERNIRFYPQPFCIKGMILTPTVPVFGSVVRIELTT